MNTWTINEAHLPGKCKQCFTKLSTVEDTFLVSSALLHWGDRETGGLGDWGLGDGGTGRRGDREIGDWETGGLGDGGTERRGDWVMGDWEMGGLGEWGNGRWGTGRRGTERWGDWEMGDWEMWGLLSHKRKGLRWLAVFIEWCSCNAHNLCFSSYSTSYVLNLQENVLFMHVTFEEKLFLVTQI